jgi:NAD(P)-dependent dehydrogenase (short-subunit alcohol dehydrogenase family)
MPAFDLNGKVVLVTGAARGIGYETARQMQMRGASVVVLDIDPQQAADAAERIGERTLGIGADVTDQGQMMAAVAQTVDKFGGLDCVVANAGIAQKQLGTVYGMSGEEWERVLEVDLLGVFRTVRAALPQIVERRGQVAVVSSVYAFANGLLNSPYAVAKPGVEALGRALRVELAPHGASATVAYFGWVDTTMVRDAFAQPDTDRLNEGIPAFLLKRITPAQAAAAFVRGIEDRAPRVFAPKWWRYYSAFRGLINPLLDKRTEREAKTQSLIKEIDERAMSAGSTPGASATGAGGPDTASVPINAPE